MRSLKTLCCLALLINCVTCTNVRVDPLVITSQGLVRGQRAADGDYSMFLGIPFAQVDPNNAFGESLPYPNFEDVFDAADGSSECPQIDQGSGDTIGDLDCLRLNVYVPNKASSQNPLPVMVWIYGGGFFEGSAGWYDGSYLAKHDVVMVTINYRVGPYGFMCLDIPEVPGNQGLKDQYTALQWIKNNIAAFGGDANSITVFGQSAGAGSIDLHLYSPYERLFHKAIVQSGSAKVEGMFVNPDYSAAVNIAQFLGFNTTDSSEAIGFLSNTNSHLVIAASSSLGYWFRPCKEMKFDGVVSFVEQDSQNQYSPARIRNTPLFVGTTSDEEYTYDMNEFAGDPFLEKIKTHYSLSNGDLTHISNIMRHFYIGDEEISADLLRELNDFKQDFHFQHPIDRAIVKYIEQGANVYQYIFAYSSDDSPVYHSAELKYLFSPKFDPLNESDDRELMMSECATTLWTNFAKYGNPTPEPTEEVPVTLEKATVDKRSYLHIDKEVAVKYRPFSQRMAFWDLFYDQYGFYNVLNTEAFQRNSYK